MTDQKKLLPKPTVMEQLYPGRFLSAPLLLGKRVTLTISDVDLEILEGDDGAKTRGVLTFKGTDKQLVLAKTNALCIKAMFGNQVADWIGKRVTFHEEPVKFGGETKPGVRVWGSPDIERDMNIKVQLPRRKATDRTLHRVDKTERADPPQSEPRQPARAQAEPTPEEKDRERFGF